MKENLVLGIVAHVDSGKTTLSEALLYENGQIRKKGRVDHGDTFLDSYDLEKERGITIFSKQAILEQGERKITLLDTPGHVDFSAEMERALFVMDGAVLIISALDGVQGHTRTVWKLLKQYHIPTVIFVNKMDASPHNKEEILEKLRKELSENIADFSCREGEEFYEQIALAKEELLNEFLERGEISDNQQALAVSDRLLFPCFFGSALKMEAVREFLDFLFDFIKVPEFRKDFGARVYKISRDEQGNRVTHLKLTGGTLKNKQILSGKIALDEQPLSGDSDSTDENRDEEWKEKINEIRLYSGDKYESLQQAEAGMLVAVTGLNHSLPLSGLGFEAENIAPKLQPVLSYRIVLPDGVDALSMLPKLKQLEEEEPELHVEWDEHLKELKAKFMGEVQLELVKHQVEERFGLGIQFAEGRILYKETVAETCYGVGHFEPLRHYAEVHLKLEPGENGSGVQIAADCSEDLLAKNWQRLIMTHLDEKEHKGVLTGSPLTDVKITVIAGRAHMKHTVGGDFRQATYRAVREALMESKSVLLEPFYEFELLVPVGMVGRAMTDLELMSAKFQMEESKNPEESLLTGIIPVSTTGDYSVRVNSYTKGKGSFHTVLKGYYPCHNSLEVVEERAYDPEADYFNTADSVFCIHGVGEIIPWYQVRDYADVDVETGRLQVDKGAYYEGMEPLKASHNTQEERVLAVEEIDRLVDQASSANRRSSDEGKPGYLKKKIKEKEYKSTAKEWRYHPKEQKPKYLLVDGYNVIFAWEDLKELAKDNMDAARGKLMDLCSEYQSMKHMELILVFDAYRVEGHDTEFSDYHNIHVVYTKEAETADFYIEHFSHENASKYDITVVTSDGLEQIIIRGQGCQLISSREFEKELKESRLQLHNDYQTKKQKEQQKIYFNDLLSEEDKKNLDLL